MKIYAIVVTYNGMHWYDRCFLSLRESQYPVTTIVIDNASSDDTVDRMKKDLNMIKWFKSFNKKFPAHLYLSHLHYTIFHYAHNVPTKLVIKHYLLHLYYALLSFPQSKYKIKEAQRAFKIVMKPRITQTKLYRLLKNN